MDTKTIIIGHNQEGKLRYVQTASGLGCTATGITPDRAKATEFEGWDAARAVLRKVEEVGTWRGYGWRVREAVVRPCGVPYSTADVCWCQPFDGPKHPQCPMHGTEAPEPLYYGQSE
jgi:hypothetical protein